MRVVIVGATGNVGTAVLRRLRLEEGVELAGVVRQVPPADAGEPYSGVDWTAADVADAASIPALTLAFTGADAVIHLAWLLQPNHDERLMAATNIDGLRHVLAAVAAAGVPQVVVASSVGAYSPGPKVRRVDESWPTGGLHSSHYARHKAVNERILDRFEQEHPGVVVTRLRPGLVMQGDVGEELRALFAGGLVPVRWLGRVPLLVLPMPPRTVAQVVHASDLADAVARIVLQRAGGPFNIAGEPVIGPREVARVLKARWLPIRIAPLRGLVWLAWHLRLVAADPGWIDIATSVPVMSTERARRELGWAPAVDTVDALDEAVHGVAQRRTVPGSPHLGGARRS
jgi:nucleoside-diphosphate-sugar epimerase